MGAPPSAEDRRALTGAEVLAEDLDDWRWVLDRLVARFDTGGFSAGAAFVARIAEVADEVDHHPDVDLRYPHVTVSLVSHDVHAITARDVRLARRISELAAEAGHAASAAPDLIELALDTPDRDAVKPFWRAMLGYVDVPGLESEIRDRADRTTTVWFQDSDSEAEGRQRWHLDVSVPAEQAEARVQAAIDAGGRLVSDERAPAFWVLADPEGNLGCICTWQARD
jgi:4a-hydroxytetrahydrobiopterin dehydratase